ncbi:hypothetical protein [Rhodoblastus sp.]
MGKEDCAPLKEQFNNFSQRLDAWTRELMDKSASCIREQSPERAANA